MSVMSRRDLGVTFAERVTPESGRDTFALTWPLLSPVTNVRTYVRTNARVQTLFGFMVLRDVGTHEPMNPKRV